MKSSYLAATLLAMLGLSAAGAAPMPGAIQGSVNVTSIQNIENVFVPILSYYMINNKTIDLNYKDSGWFYSIEVDSVHIDTASGFTRKLFEFENSTNTIHAEVGGVDVNLELQGKIYALWFIPFDMSVVNITDLSLAFDLTFNDENAVQWQLGLSPKFSLKDLEFKMKSGFLNWIIGLAHSTILKAVDAMIPDIYKTIDAAVQQFNVELKNENSTTFLTPLLDNNYLLNLTTPSAPVADHAQDIVNFWLDGTFFDTTKKTVHTTFVNSEFMPRFADSHSEQFFIHESFVASGFSALAGEFFPATAYDANVAKQLLEVFDAMRDYYGADANVTLTLGLLPSESDAVKLTTAQGIVPKDLQVELTLNAKNASMKEFAEAASFQMAVDTSLNFTFQDFTIYVMIQPVAISNVKITKNNCGIVPRHYDSLFTAIFKTLVDQVNLEYKGGYNLALWNQNIGFIEGMITNTTLSTGVADGFFYGGFSFFTDAPMLASPQEQEAEFTAKLLQTAF